MTRSLYILGGAGTGKSTFTAELMTQLVDFVGPLTDLAMKPNARGTKITLRGHPITTVTGDEGTYVGVLRDEYPGTDGLDSASSIAGVEWLRNAALGDLILIEGNKLVTKPFLDELATRTDLLMVHLTCPEFVRELRFMQRGSQQDPGWVKNTDTRCRNAFNRYGGLDVDSSDPAAWSLALAAALQHLKGTT